MVGAVTTLAWAVILFLIVIYVVSLLFRESLGPELVGAATSTDDVGHYFQTVPRSMFTVFRCSFGDCTTASGTPLFEHVTRDRGGLWSIVYCAFLFIVVIGVFNVISAIFVQATLAAAEDMAVKKKRMRLEDESRWATHLWTLLKVLIVRSTPDEAGTFPLMPGRSLDKIMEEMTGMDFDRELFDRVLREENAAVLALDNLDIDPQDHRYLSDILDPDNNGTIGVLELLDGLKRLRGEPRRSDIIAIDLMVRSLQEKVDNIWRFIRDKPELAHPDQGSAWQESMQATRLALNSQTKLSSLPTRLSACD